MRASALLCISLLIACQSETTQEQGTYTVVDSAEVQIVESHSPAWGREGRRIDPEPLVRIGREEEGPYQFGFLYRALFLKDGTLVVPEVGTQEVRYFNPDGTHQGTFGGSGQGPGEFQRLSQVFRYPGDSLAAFDGQLFRTTVFSPKTGGNRTVLNRVEGNYGGFGVLGNGRFLLYSPGGSFHPELPPGLQWVFTNVISVDPSEGSWEVIASLPGRQQLVEPDGNTGRVTPPFYAIQAVAENGFYWGTPDRFEIGFYDGEGTLRRILRRPIQPAPVEPSMIEEWIEATLDEVRQREGDAAVARYRSRYEEGLFGDYVPFFGIAFVDADERLWVSGPAWPSVDPTPKNWSVFSGDGFWLGDLEAPKGTRIVDSLGDLVLVIWYDEMDIPHVQLHRLMGG